jgi:DNA-binding response OmpR family regulator
MNTVPPEVKGSSVDIFIFSIQESIVPQITEQLEKKGYRVTRFGDGNCLLETLRTAKPNLLICDTTTSGSEAYDVCRQIKADDNLWVIPVLMLTNASVLSDFLPVLDCNADNFIPLPFDIPTGLSVIENMLGTPVERQTADQIKTQFKIRHDDQIYCVAASRRKLLELLLSSFDIAVNKSSELSQVKAERQTLSESTRFLEDRVTEQTRLMDTFKATLQQKDQKISALTTEIEEKKRLLIQKTRKAVIVTNDDHSPPFPEKMDAGISTLPEMNTLIQQISELSHELEAAKASLDAVQEQLDEEKNHCTSLECTLDLLVQQKEFGEKSLRSLNEEHEQIVSALQAERNRVVSAEQELETVIQAKTQSEQELTQVLNDFNEARNQLSVDLNRLKEKLEVETDRRISAENQLGSLRQEKEQSESFLRSSVTELKDQLDDLRAQLEATRTELENEENSTRLLKENLAEIVTEREKTRIRVREERESDNAALKKQKNDLEAATAFSKTLERNLNAIKIQNKALVGELNRANQNGAQSDQQVRQLTEELKKAREALETERNLHEAEGESFEILMPAIKRTEQGQPAVEKPDTPNELAGNKRKLRVISEDITESVIEKEHDLFEAEQNEPDLFEEGHTGQEFFEDDLHAAADKHVDDPKQSFPLEETREIRNEEDQDDIKKAENLPAIVEHLSLVPAALAAPDTETSPDSEKEPVSPTPPPPMTEVTLKSVTDIIDFFGDNDSIEEDNPF